MLKNGLCSEENKRTIAIRSSDGKEVKKTVKGHVLNNKMQVWSRQFLHIELDLAVQKTTERAGLNFIYISV